MEVECNLYECSIQECFSWSDIKSLCYIGDGSYK